MQLLAWCALHVDSHMVAIFVGKFCSLLKWHRSADSIAENIILINDNVLETEIKKNYGILPVFHFFTAR